MKHLRWSFFAKKCNGEMFDCVLKHASDFFFFFMVSIYVCVISVVKADLYWQLIRKLKNAICAINLPMPKSVNYMCGFFNFCSYVNNTRHYTLLVFRNINSSKYLLIHPQKITYKCLCGKEHFYTQQNQFHSGLITSTM